ncbi:MAG: TIGR03862 family flavoprotein [Alphaproteobacteria bacterium]|nr:MAG: TIGR03862 family flavoprotein [Alphaproteobacteria bacterium]
MTQPSIAIVGAGPTGLMAAERLAEAGFRPVLYDAMPTPARKFLMAGKSGLNITHSEPLDQFVGRYGTAHDHIGAAVRAFPPAAVREWAAGLGTETFVGSSGRVFPTEFKASPLLRAWLGRLGGMGVTLKTRHRWTGWTTDGALAFDTPDGAVAVQADATLLALGGPSWPRLGSDGAWVQALRDKGVDVQPFRPANCGFDCEWSAYFKDRFAGEPVKGTALSFADQRLKGDFVISHYGVEGSAIYGLSAALRDHIEAHGSATLSLDLMPDRSTEAVLAMLSKPRGKKSFATHLKKSVHLSGVKAALLRECLKTDTLADTIRLAAALKALPIKLTAPRPVAEAISTAGGISLEALDDALMLKAVPGVFAAGEMLDWEAPTGGYLLTGCLAEGRRAAEGMIRYFAGQ